MHLILKYVYKMRTKWKLFVYSLFNDAFSVAWNFMVE
jgi:hypothetical protein